MRRPGNALTCCIISLGLQQTCLGVSAAETWRHPPRFLVGDASVVQDERLLRSPLLSGTRLYLKNLHGVHGGFLDVRGADCDESNFCVSTAMSLGREPTGLSSTWSIWRANGEPGVLKSGDLVHIRSLHGVWQHLEVRGRDCQGTDMFCVSVTSSPVGRRDSILWQIELHGNSIGSVDLSDGDVVQLKSLFGQDGGYLDVRGSGCMENLYCVSTASEANRDQGSGLWQVRFAEEPSDNPCRLGVNTSVAWDVPCGEPGSGSDFTLLYHYRPQLVDTTFAALLLVVPEPQEMLPAIRDVDITPLWLVERSMARAEEAQTRLKQEQEEARWQRALSEGAAEDLTQSMRELANWASATHCHASVAVVPYTSLPKLAVWETTSPSCPRPPEWCPSDNFQYSEADCNGDGILDRICSSTNQGIARVWIRLSGNCGEFDTGNAPPCSSLVARALGGNAKYGTVPGSVSQYPPPPFILRVRPGLQGRRYVDVLSGTSVGLRRRLDCVAPRMADVDTANGGLVIAQGLWGSYLTVVGGSYDGIRTRSEKPGLLWGSEPLLPLDSSGRTLVIPEGVTSIMIDVGANRFSTLLRKFGASSVGNARNGSASILFILVEPDGSVADELLSQTRLATTNGHHYWLLRAAIAKGTPDGFATFYKTDSPLCSSMRHPTSTHIISETYFQQCKSVIAEDIVPVIPLAHLLQRLPGKVQRLKVDAQGADLEVLASGDWHLARVQEVELECQNLPKGDARMLYPDGHTKDEAVQFLTASGFRLVRCLPNNEHIEEENCLFFRADRRFE